jgi:hypothetical protein
MRILARAPEGLRQKLAPAPRFPRLREAVLAHAQEPDRLRDALASTAVHPVEVTILNIIAAILDEWLLNQLPTACRSTWGRYVAMGMLTAVYRAGSPAEFALAFRSPDVWEEAILELLTKHRPPAPLGYPDRVHTAGKLRDYVIGSPLRWNGFERTVEEALRGATAPDKVLWAVRRAAPAWATAPVLTAVAELANVRNSELAKCGNLDRATAWRHGRPRPQEAPQPAQKIAGSRVSWPPGSSARPWLAAAQAQMQATRGPVSEACSEIRPSQRSSTHGSPPPVPTTRGRPVGAPPAVRQPGGTRPPGCGVGGRRRSIPGSGL